MLRDMSWSFCMLRWRGGIMGLVDSEWPWPCPPHFPLEQQWDWNFFWSQMRWCTVRNLTLHRRARMRNRVNKSYTSTPTTFIHHSTRHKHPNHIYTPPHLPTRNTHTVLLRLLRSLLGRLLGHLLAPCDLRLDADAAKDEPHAEPLHVGQAVAKGDDAEDHGEHLAGDGHGDEEDRGEC